MSKKLSQKMMCALLTAAVLTSSAVSVDAAYAGHWAERQLNQLAEAGHIGEAEYADSPLTVAKLEEILNAIPGAPKDFKINAKADAVLTREAAFTAMARFAGLSDGDISVLSAFLDADKVDDYAKNAVSALVSGGYVKGSGEGLLNPDKTLTVAEAAVMAERLEFIVNADEEGYVYGTARLTWEQFWENENITYADKIPLDAQNEIPDSEKNYDLGGFDAVTRATSKHGIYRGLAHFSYIFH